MKLFNNTSPETQMEFGKALFNLANLSAVVVFFRNGVILEGLVLLIVLYLFAFEILSDGEEVKSRQETEKAAANKTSGVGLGSF